MKLTCQMNISKYLHKTYVNKSFRHDQSPSIRYFKRRKEILNRFLSMISPSSLKKTKKLYITEGTLNLNMCAYPCELKLKHAKGSTMRFQFLLQDSVQKEQTVIAQCKCLCTSFFLAISPGFKRSLLFKTNRVGLLSVTRVSPSVNMLITCHNNQKPKRFKWTNRLITTSQPTTSFHLSLPLIKSSKKKYNIY